MVGDSDTDADGLHVLTGIEDIHQRYHFSDGADLHYNFDYDLWYGHFGRYRAIRGDDEWVVWQSGDRF